MSSLNPPIPNKKIEINDFHNSNDFVISGGTVALDIIHSKVLLVRNRRHNEIYLPKGRKDIGEVIEATAVRETREEAGFDVKLLDVNAPSRATKPANVATSPISKDQSSGAPVISTKTEAVAVTQRMVHGCLKVIFWFAAVGDSTATIGRRPEDDERRFESIWAPWDDAEKLLTFDDDRNVARFVIGAQKAKQSKNMA